MLLVLKNVKFIIPRITVIMKNVTNKYPTSIKGIIVLVAYIEFVVWQPNALR